MSSIFINKYGRLHSGWRAALFFFVCFTLQIAFQAFAGAILTVANVDIDEGSLAVWGAGLFISFVIAVLCGWGFGKVLEGLPFAALGWSFTRGWLRDLLGGILVGALTMLLACGICLAVGPMHFRWNEQSGVRDTLLGAGVMFLIGAAAEESLFRGYLLQTLTRANLAWVAIVITSLFFASAHLGNPNSSILALVNTLLAGIWFSAAYLKTRSLWLPFSAHFAWNWFQGAIFGIPVSGITRVTPTPLLLQTDSGPAWLTGGSYGIEGGIACTVALVLSTALIWFLPIFKADEKMLILTSEEKPVQS
jgi:membrane protease YdiL (CAAX protease family)